MATTSGTTTEQEKTSRNEARKTRTNLLPIKKFLSWSKSTT